MKGSVKLMGKKRFTPEYKEEIIKLITERRKKISEVAKDIGVTSTSIRRWITQYSEYGKDAFPGKGNLRAEDDKIRKLMRDNIDLKEENEILKKATAIFSRDAKWSTPLWLYSSSTDATKYKSVEGFKLFFVNIFIAYIIAARDPLQSALPLPNIFPSLMIGFNGSMVILLVETVSMCASKHIPLLSLPSI